jgi:hypothetical protein
VFAFSAARSTSHGRLLQKLKAQSHNPIFINSCETDQQFPPEKAKYAPQACVLCCPCSHQCACRITDELLGNGQYKAGYERAYFAGCTHGFAVRGDMSKPEVKAGKEGAFKNAVEFFIKHL